MVGASGVHAGREEGMLAGHEGKILSRDSMYLGIHGSFSSHSFHWNALEFMAGIKKPLTDQIF